MLRIQLYKNTNSESRGYNKWYGRVDGMEMYDLDKLAKHMADHSCPYTIGVIHGVLKDMAKCIRHLVLDGNKVKIDDLAILKCQVETTGANSAADFNLQKNVRNVKLSCYATGEMRRMELNKDAVMEYSTYAQYLRDPDGDGGNANP